MMEVICANEECKKKFEMDVQTEITKDGHTQVFFKCPHCDREYNCYIETQYTLGLQEQINEVRSRLTTVKIGKKHKELMERYIELKGKKRTALSKINRKQVIV